MIAVNSPRIPSRLGVVRASMRREWLSHRLNRFLYAHLALVLTAGCLPLLSPGEALGRGAPWWLMHAVLYAVSLSAVLFGLSSAQAETEELPWLVGQPAGIGTWLAGKLAALATLVAASTALLGLPVALAGGASAELGITVAGATCVAVVCALFGFVVGSWIRDAVRGLVAAIALWLVMLFGVDLLLIALAGAPWAQSNPDIWTAPLMANPLDAFRLTVLFAVERAAFTGLQPARLAGWWSVHAAGWMLFITIAWSALAILAAWLGARRRLDD
jgi:ABC-2 type transport system permease protein/Cu-processing system permease protein